MDKFAKKIFAIRGALSFSKRNLSSNLNEDPKFMGILSHFTNELKFTNKDSYRPMPIFRLMKPSNNDAIHEKLMLSNETMLKMYQNMVTISIMDGILYQSQRQGRISFYMTNSGEEAVQIGSAAAFAPSDVIYAQYRESGVLMYRGFKMSQFMNQCYGNCEDDSKGRQMPVHYGCKELNFVTISSPLTTQLPQAVGAAYALKRKKSESCVVCYFGDGAASEGDAHAAFNFAATLDCPIVFICRNNGYAISTPTSEQYKGDGIAARGPAYGINTIRIDGNDTLATYHASQEAREFAIKNNKPVLIEAMTYRVGHHSTSDDSTAYRSSDEIAQWLVKTPVMKFRNYLEEIGLWSEEQEEELLKTTKELCLKEFGAAEKRLKPNWKEMFTDVYHEMPGHIKEQLQEMEEHVKEFGEHYPLDSFAKQN